MRHFLCIALVAFLLPCSAQVRGKKTLQKPLQKRDFRAAKLAAMTPARIDSRPIPVIVMVEGDAMVEFHRTNTSPLLIDHRPFRMDQELSDSAALAHRASLSQTRSMARQHLQSLGFVPAGETDVVMHTLIGTLAGDRIEEAAHLPGVRAVYRARAFHRNMDGALPLINALSGWLLIGGESNAGKGMKIAVIDSGVDINNPMMQDYSLTPPAGFPKGESAYTNSKVIVARNYIALNGDPKALPIAQDRDGHGTFVAGIAAGHRVIAPFASLAGVAPAAFVGNYRVFSSPENGGATTDAAIIAAINDAVADGMNVISLSLGAIPIDQPSLEPIGLAITAATQGGVLVVCAAGNDGPDAGTVSEPSNSPEAISVAASRNARLLGNILTVNGPGVVDPSLQHIVATPGDGPSPSSAIRANLWPLIGLACDTYSSKEKTQGAIVLAADDFCAYADMADLAAAGGAKALVIYRQDDLDPFEITQVQFTTIPIFEISANDGAALAAASTKASNALDTTISAKAVATPVQADVIASFSSEGPDGVTMQLKPEISAPGTSIYSGTQINDAAGDLYEVSQFAIGSGTSFSTPMVAGTALLVQQTHPTWTPAQVKSAIVNSAANVVTDNGQQAAMIASGDGRLDVQAALQSTIALAPTTLSFSSRVYSGPATFTQTLTITNLGSTAEAFNVALRPRIGESGGTLSVSPSTTPVLNPRDTATVTMTFAGNSVKSSVRGTSDGRVLITGASSGSVATIPYWGEIVGSSIPFSYYLLRGQVQTQPVSTKLPQDLVVEVVDDSGLIGMAGVPVKFTVSSGGGTLTTTDAVTDFTGLASTSWTLGAAPGTQRVQVDAVGSTNYFYASAIANPTVSRAGLVNAASFTTAVAPGSIASLFGTGLAVASGGATSLPLPVSLNSGQILFGNTASPIFYASPGQMNFQIPLEIPLGADGTATVQMRSVVVGTPSQPVTVQLVAAAPGLFTTTTDGKGTVVSLHADNSPVTASNPAHAGEVVVIFCTGLGAVDQALTSGSAAAGGNTTTLATAKIGGVAASVQYSGVTPGSVGLYQVNAVIPPGTPAGDASVVISIGSAASNQVTIPIR